jgi:hypothetical protein
MRYFPLRRTKIVAMALVLGASYAAAAAAQPMPGLPAGPGLDIRPANRLLNLDVHAYGLSYHTDREGVRRNGKDNEVNTGLGLSYTTYEDQRGAAFVEAGFYRDSGSSQAKYAGAGYQYKLGKRWRLGGALLGIQSETYNDGRFFIAPLPILSYNFGAVKLNAVYVPRVAGYNEFAVYGFYFSMPFTN